MANNQLKEKTITLAIQRLSLERLYPNLIEKICINKGVLICIMKLQPSSFSSWYKVKIQYKLTDGYPKVWLLEPTLNLFDGKRLHHLYGVDDYGHPCLCVYYPGFKEWKPKMDIAKVFVPWIITWLYAYEYWLITGKWLYEEAPRKVVDDDCNKYR